MDDLNVLFRFLDPNDDNQNPGGVGDAEGDGAAGAGGQCGAADPAADGKDITEQGMVVDGEKRKKKRKNRLTRDSARDQRLARLSRGLSNDIAHFDDALGNYIHPLSILALAATLYKRPVLFFSVTGTQVKLQSIVPPYPGAQLPIYLATDEKDTSIIYMLVPQQELHTYP